MCVTRFLPGNEKYVFPEKIPNFCTLKNIWTFHAVSEELQSRQGGIPALADICVTKCNIFRLPSALVAPEASPMPEPLHRNT